VALTIRPVPYAVPQPLSENDTVLELIDTLAHREEAVVRFAHAGEGVQQRIGDTVHNTSGVLWVWWVCDMLVHVHVLLEKLGHHCRVSGLQRTHSVDSKKARRRVLLCSVGCLASLCKKRSKLPFRG
jgi:hypothetical protein